MNRKFVTVLMAACLIVTLFAGCGGKDQDALSTGPNAGVSPTQEPGTAAGADAAIPGESQNVDEQAGGTDAAEPQGGNAAGTTAKGSGGQTTTKKSSGASSTTTKKNPSGGSGTTKPNGGSSNTTTKPSGNESQMSSRAEIVAYFNKAANKVKTGKPKLKASYSMYMDIPMEISGEKPFEPESIDYSQTYTAGSNLNDAFPVFGQSWASQLQINAVQSASCVLKNGQYTLKIVMKDENNVTNVSNSAHGKAFSSILTDEDIEEMLHKEGFVKGRMTSSLHDSTITCIVDAKTGNMLSANYVLKNNMSMRIIATSGMFVVVPLQLDNTQTYQMTW